MKTLKVLTIVAITGLIGATAANASPSNKGNGTSCPKQEKCEKQNKGKMYRYDKRSEMKEIYQKLDLTAEQKTAMKENRESMREYRKAQRGKMQDAHGLAAMGKFISADGFDKQGFMDMATQRSQERIEMRAAMFEKKINILTAEQRVELMTILEEKSK